MSAALKLRPRDVPPRAAFALEQAGVPPLLARLYAARGVRDPQELDPALAHLLPPGTLRGMDAASRLLAQAVREQWPTTIVADYDCDGASACAVALRGLALLGLAPDRLDFIVPDRQVHGYGLTPTIVDLIPPGTRLLLTVDNGIASLDGVRCARERGLKVLITDHHLPAVIDGQPVLPDADAVVNPNQPDCGFASKHLAGVGVMFYVLMATRAALRDSGHYPQGQPRLDDLLDLVALGTVADVVRLDANNRRLVAQGLQRMRSGRLSPGVRALFVAAGRDPARACASDLGFAVGPRINAAGRLADMRIGIQCLATANEAEATRLAEQLDQINRERRGVESNMRDLAESQVLRLAQRALHEGQGDGQDGASAAGLALFDDSFHEGVVGIVAGRLKDQLHRPVFVFAPGQDGLLKGSGRSIAGLHLRDALDWISKQAPDLLVRFGGHAMAAGCTLRAGDFPAFERLFTAVTRAWLTPETLQRTLLTDGPLPASAQTAQTARLLRDPVWGQGFEAPVFCDRVQVLEQRLVGGRHTRLRVRALDSSSGASAAAGIYNAIWFGHTDPVPDTVALAYQLALDEFRGADQVQWVVQAAV
ncbi:single-stranded-DNA-specific exonuclease RecJ [Amphibiibacter pelophylacis]|uniref:DHHA1 domain-containing protein n=1 Tax=Amphibiibacter pelophylacis TaxID=1799477 RepID=A0ACC6NYY2_9BURK